MYSGACFQPLQPTSCLLLYQLLTKNQATIHIQAVQIPLLIAPASSKKLPVFPSAHTYIHKHVFMEVSGKCSPGRGIRIKITLNSKQRIEASVDRVPATQVRTPNKVCLSVCLSVTTYYTCGCGCGYTKRFISMSLVLHYTQPRAYFIVEGVKIVISPSQGLQT